jgi:hypothetical protein
MRGRGRYDISVWTFVSAWMYNVCASSRTSIINGYRPVDNYIQRVMVIILTCSATRIEMSFVSSMLLAMMYVHQVYVPSPVPSPVPSVRTQPRKHIVLVSHYRESRQMLLRTLCSIERASKEVPDIKVHVVLAVEQSSHRITEKWPDDWCRSQLDVLQVVEVATRSRVTSVLG